MKRGFLKTARYKRVIEEACVPQPSPSGQPRPSERPGPRLAQKCAQSSAPRPGGSGDAKNHAASAPKDNAMDVQSPETPEAGTVLQEVYADGHVVAVRVTRPGQDTSDVQMVEPQDVDADGEAKTPFESRKDDQSAGAEPHHVDKGKGKEKAVNPDDDDATKTSRRNKDDANVIRRFWDRNPPGWGRHPAEEIFHTVPGSLDGPPCRKREVFRVWPRDPKGKPIYPSISGNHLGTLSADGYPWAATLFDLFFVQKFPDVSAYVSVATSSAILETVEAIGELDAAPEEIEWAKSESKPRVQGAAGAELAIMLLNFQDMKAQEETETKLDKGKHVTAQAPTEDAKNASPSTTPHTSSLDPDREWLSFTPFEHERSILLQERIPYFLLPQKIYVHDPFRLLTTRMPKHSYAPWTSQPDIIRTYNLRLSETSRQKCEDTRQKAEELEEFKARTLIILRYQRTKEQIKNHEPVIEVPLPPYRRCPTKIEESHLYLSPVAKVGVGHHSIVYKGEWELPRDMFVKQRFCFDSLCFQKCIDKEVQRLKDTGRWDKMLRAVSWGPTGFTGRRPTQAELDEVNDPPHLGTDGETIEREITCIVPPNAIPSKIVAMIDLTDTWDTLMKNREVHATLLNFTRDKSTEDSGVAVVRINPPSSYKKSCAHDSFQARAPRTAIFTVVAKLSLPYDSHLDCEANNYQAFPDRFFDHYDGYTVISRICAIVPVSAVVPQFYGYYVPETSKTEVGTPYLSPILLLEHCGEPIEPERLSHEDQQECMSLLLRFQCAGWIHDSVAPRNFLKQSGRPTDIPLMREWKPDLSFRLIDFGRSRKYDGDHEKKEEEAVAFNMFGKLTDGTGLVKVPL